MQSPRIHKNIAIWESKRSNLCCYGILKLKMTQIFGWPYYLVSILFLLHHELTKMLFMDIEEVQGSNSVSMKKITRFSNH